MTSNSESAGAYGAAGGPRHRLFAAALAHSGLSLHELWLAYLALGGVYDAFDLDAYLQGLTAWAAHEQDTLALALNEHHHEMYVALLVPYLLIEDPALHEPSAQLRAAIADLLRTSDDKRPDETGTTR